MTVSKKTVMAEMRRIALPDGGNIVDLNMIKALRIDGDQVSFVLEVPARLGASMEPVRMAAERLLGEFPGVSRANVVMTAHSETTSPPGRASPPDLRLGQHARPSTGPQPIRDVAKIIAVASGKGGVGKSTIASNLAVAMSRLGYRVGLLDADIHGPSLPLMMGVSARPTSPDGKTIIPLRAHGVTLMSIGLLLPAQEAVIWRGPMLMGALQQMLQQVRWGSLDVLLVDLPPGTGDVQLTLCQKFDLTGSIIVCTPQDVALLDARRAIAMFRKLNRPILGIVENMAYFHCPNCDGRFHLFGRHGARDEARKLDLPFLGSIPLELEIRVAGDTGKPIATTSHEVTRMFELIGELIA